jgi:hypothetical protein
MQGGLMGLFGRLLAYNSFEIRYIIDLSGFDDTLIVCHIRALYVRFVA